MIINSGIKEVVYLNTYSFNETAKGLFDQAGVIIRAIQPE